MAKAAVLSPETNSIGETDGELARRQIEEARILAERDKREREEALKQDKPVRFLNVSEIDDFVAGLSTRSTGPMPVSLPGRLRISQKSLSQISEKVRTMIEDMAMKAVETQAAHYYRNEIEDLKEAWI